MCDAASPSKLHNNQRSKQEFPRTKVLNIILSSLAQESECKLCEVIVDTIYENLENNATKEDIVKALETACNYLPYVKSQVCDSSCYQKSSICSLLNGTIIDHFPFKSAHNWWINTPLRS